MELFSFIKCLLIITLSFEGDQDESNAIHHRKSQNLPLAVISQDVCKAFDRINWQFLEEFLSKMNMGQHFMNSIVKLYKNSYAQVRVNGIDSKAFSVARGV